MPAGYKRRRPPSTNLIERVTSSTTGMLVLLGLAGWSNAQPESTTTTSSNDNVSRFMPDDETTLLGANDTTATSETEIILPPPNIRSVSGAFSASLGGVLIVMVLFRIFALFLLCRHRKESALQLAQSSVLSVFVVVGTIALGSCYLVLPLHDVTCLLRDPLIFTPLTICGNILLGRIWRIIVLMTPVLKERRQRGVLSALSHIAYSNECTKFNQASLRRKVTLGRLLYMVCLLSVPQVLFQVCHVLVPSMRGSLTITESGDPWHVPKYECETGHGYWTTWISVVLMMVPYVFAAYVSLRKVGDLPKVFDETAAVWKSIKVVFLVISVAGPAIGMVESVDGQAYLLVCIFGALAEAPMWGLVYPKLYQVLRGTEKRLKIGQVLRKSTLDMTAEQRAENNHEKTAKLALMIGKMYEEMGLVQKSITLFDDALAVWQVDPARAKKQKIGGFTMDEIASFSSKDLEYIIQLLIAKGRVEGTFHSTADTGTRNAAQAWLEALEIYEQCPASIDMRDRSIIFPIFSGLFVFLKGGKIQQDKQCHFEQNLVRKFAEETEEHGDPVHYTRALAMQCEVSARLGKYKSALTTFERLKSIYIPEEHSKGVADQYGTDRSGQAFSQVALWYMQLGRIDEALAACEDVIRCLLPLMDPTNVLNSCELLLPVIRILKPRGQEMRMKQLFQEYVVDNFEKHFGKDGVTPCLPVFKPLTMLLAICHDEEAFPDFEDAVEWLVDEEKCSLPDFLDSVYTKLCWSPFDMVAELCLRVASRLNNLNGSINDCRSIVMNGLRLARKAEKKMKDAEGNVTLPIAFHMHEPVMNGLLSLARELDVELYDKESSTMSNSNGNDSTPDLANLPDSYVKAASDSSATGPSTGSGSARMSAGLNLASSSSLDSSSQNRRRPSFSLVEPVTEEDCEDNDPTTRHRNESSSELGLAIELGSDEPDVGQRPETRAMDKDSPA